MTHTFDFGIGLFAECLCGCGRKAVVEQDSVAPKFDPEIPQDDTIDITIRTAFEDEWGDTAYAEYWYRGRPPNPA